MMQNYLSQLQSAVTAWDGVVAHPHRFGGVEFNLGKTEIGHVHRNGMVDIPFNSRIRSQLVAEGKAEPHHLLKDTGWISFYIHSQDDVRAAINLFRLSYLFNAARGRSKAALSAPVNINAELASLDISPLLQAIFHDLTAGR